MYPQPRSGDVQDIRPLKLKQKMSDCCRTGKGIRDFANLRNIIETAHKKSWNMLSALQTDPNEHIQ